MISRNLVGGDEVFMADGGANVFDTMIDIETHLLANDTESLSGSDLARIDAVVDNILKHRSEIGGRASVLSLSLTGLRGIPYPLKAF